MTLHTMMITADPGIAQYVTGAGNDVLFVDLENMGKADRQGHVDSWKSPHVPQDVSRLRAAAPDAVLMVRLNPFHDGTAAEIDDALARGADALMLPMFRDWQTVARFADLVADRAQVVPLVETAAALEAISPILERARPDRLHIGLNDLHLDLGCRFMFQPLAEGLLDAPAAALREAGVPFGIGGLARLDEGTIPARMVLGEHARLGSTWAILSRSFHDRSTTLDELQARIDFAAELQALRDCHQGWLAAGPLALADNRNAFRAAVAAAAG